MVQSEKQPISLFEHLDEVTDMLSQKDAFVFLDYDGTLTPIVATPDKAVLSDDMRYKVQQLSEKCKVAIVSGRATDDVRRKVGIDNIFYAGSHGFEIVSPDGTTKINDQAQAIKPVIDEVYQTLSDELKEVQGALVEHVKYTISTHYRLVADQDFLTVKEAVDNVLSQHPNLRMTSGKKVFEIRPDIDWHKGRAVEWILNVLNFDSQKNIALYIGDDTTDEDAFDVVQGCGFGILVAEDPRDTKAQYVVRNVGEVKKILELLMEKK